MSNNPVMVRQSGFDRTNGLTIVSAVLEREFTLILTFADGTRLFLHDMRQSCCESRYITCDDDLMTLVGGVLLNIQAKPGPNLIQQDEYGDHETMFVEVQGSTGFVTLTTHNRHNGYYGGFDLKIDVYGPGELTPAEQARVTQVSNPNPWVTPRRLADLDINAAQNYVIDSVLLPSSVGRNRAERRKAAKQAYINRSR